MPRMQRKLGIIPSNGNCNSTAVPAASNEGDGGGVGRGAGSHPACASCKHQRKKCADDCILAAVFPAEKTREFQAVHKVFGVSNVIKMMRRVEARDRERVAESLIWEAASRENNPVWGALQQFQLLQEEKKQLEKELNLYKSQHHANHHHHGNNNNNHHQMIRPQGHGGGGGVMFKQASSQPLSLSCWSNGNSNNSNGKVVNGNGHNNNSMCNTNNNNVVGILQGSFPNLHNGNSNHHHGEMIDNNKAGKKGDETAFIPRQSPQPPPQLHQQQHHLLHHQHQQQLQLHHPQFIQVDHLPVQGHFAAYNFNGQAMENNQ